MAEETVFASTPVLTVAHGPVASEPHAGLVDEPAVLLKLADHGVEARQHAIPPVARLDVGWSVADRIGGGSPQAGVPMAAVLLPQQLVAELLHIAVGSAADALQTSGSGSAHGGCRAKGGRRPGARSARPRFGLRRTHEHRTQPRAASADR